MKCGIFRSVRRGQNRNRLFRHKKPLPNHSIHPIHPIVLKIEKFVNQRPWKTPGSFFMQEILYRLTTNNSRHAKKIRCSQSMNNAFFDFLLRIFLLLSPELFRHTPYNFFEKHSLQLSFSTYSYFQSRPTCVPICAQAVLHS